MDSPLIKTFKLSLVCPRRRSEGNIWRRWWRGGRRWWWRGGGGGGWSEYIVCIPLAWWVVQNSPHSQQHRTHAFGWLTLSSPTHDDGGSDDPAAEEDKDDDDKDEEEDDDEDKLKAVVKAQQLSAEENRVLENIWQGDFSSLE